MHVVACCGFPVPVSRYWREFEGVEISETELGIPGQGTVRRWLREAPEGFLFSLLAPKDIVAAGFELNETTERLVKEIGELAETMKAQAVVFAAPPEFAPSRPNKAAVKKFVESIPARYPRAVLSLSGWKLADVASVLDPRKEVIAAYDPLQDDTPPAKVELAYLRLPGPAGYRSRYDETALEKIVAHVRQSKATLTMCVFHNIDMHANASRTRELLAQAARAEKAQLSAKPEKPGKPRKAEKHGKSTKPEPAAPAEQGRRPEPAAKSAPPAKPASAKKPPASVAPKPPSSAAAVKKPAPAKTAVKKPAPAKTAAKKPAPAKKPAKATSGKKPAKAARTGKIKR